MQESQERPIVLLEEDDDDRNNNNKNNDGDGTDPTKTGEWTYIMVFANTEDSKAIVYHCKKHLTQKGRLQVRERISRDQDEILLYIGAPESMLEEMAEHLKLKKRLKPEYMSAWAHFK